MSEETKAPEKPTNVKGFRKNKQPTKAEIQKQSQEQMGQVQQQMQQMVQTMIQSMQRVRQLEMEVVAVANLLRSSSSSESAKEGDSVMIDYFGRLKNDDGTIGEPFDGGFGVGYVLQDLGAGKLIKVVEDSIVDKIAGATYKVDMKFPDDYHAETLKGKEAQFDIAVIKVWKKTDIDKHISGLQQEYVKANTPPVEAPEEPKEIINGSKKDK